MNINGSVNIEFYINSETGTLAIISISNVNL